MRKIKRNSAAAEFLFCPSSGSVDLQFSVQRAKRKQVVNDPRRRLMTRAKANVRLNQDRYWPVETDTCALTAERVGSTNMGMTKNRARI